MPKSDSKTTDAPSPNSVVKDYLTSAAGSKYETIKLISSERWVEAFLDHHAKLAKTNLPMCDFHPLEARKEGPRIPRVYGSGPTMICAVCGAWTPDWGGPSTWRPADTLEAAMQEDDDR